MTAELPDPRVIPGMTCAEVAPFLHCEPRTVARWIAAGKVPAVAIGKKPLVPTVWLYQHFDIPVPGQHDQPESEAEVIPFVRPSIAGV